MCVLVASIDTVLAAQCLKHKMARTPYSIKGYREVYERWRETMLGYSRQNRWPLTYRDLYFPVAAQSRSGCGSAYPDFLAIVKGKAAPVRAWPWYAMVIQKQTENATRFCGGTLLSDEWILTAAHCLTGKYLRLYIRLGTVRKIGGTDSFLVEREVAVAISHQLYASKGWTYDIALLKLDTPVVFSSYIQPACLPHHLTDLTSPFLDCYIAGYGLEQIKPELYPRNLQELKVETMSYRECQLYWKNGIVDHHICLRFSKRSGLCQGDSGGPLSCIGPGRAFIVAGVASWIWHGCSNKQPYPDVFVNTLNFKQWIKETIINQTGQLPPILDTNP
ncbi:neurotrypsin [Plakobranchus ocellatus]|uniref:Neurotrypsin n=1 Tax=Plakobranchus ocellatus TaxID=259542 RepID=A0AAV4AR26_9GAST|nr:neurotrypsin [Plakobranchus ocellatus]